MNQMLHEIIVFSIALTLPTYFVRGIDRLHLSFKQWHTNRQIGRWCKGKIVPILYRKPKDEVRPDDY
jgi:hypothetical protein